MIVCLDTNIVIYAVERNPIWSPKVAARLSAATAAGDSFAVSDAARLECLVGPLQKGDASLATDYQNFFASTQIRMLSVSPAVWEMAASIRARHGFEAVDAIHLASAVEAGCDLFLTNDVRLAKCSDILVVVMA